MCKSITHVIEFHREKSPQCPVMAQDKPHNKPFEFVNSPVKETEYYKRFIPRKSLKYWSHDENKRLQEQNNSFEIRNEDDGTLAVQTYRELLPENNDENEISDNALPASTSVQKNHVSELASSQDRPAHSAMATVDNPDNYTSASLSSVHRQADSTAQAPLPITMQSVIPPATTKPRSDMSYEVNRLATLQYWPSSNPVKASDLAAAGFFLFPPGDRVKCAFCNGRVKNWEQGDVPMDEHRKHYPRCPFLRGDSDNVPISQVSKLPSLFDIPHDDPSSHTSTPIGPIGNPSHQVSRYTCILEKCYTLS